MGADLAQGKHAHLREGALGSARLRLAEESCVVRCVGHVEDETVQGHQPHAAVEGGRSVGTGQQFDDLVCQQADGSVTQSLACLGEGVALRSAAFAETLQVLEDLAVTVLGEQPQAEDEINHEPVRQAGAVTSVMAGFVQDFLHHCHGNDTFQSAEPLVGWQLLQFAKDGLPRHEGLLCRWVPNNLILGGDPRLVQS